MNVGDEIILRNCGGALKIKIVEELGLSQHKGQGVGMFDNCRVELHNGSKGYIVTLFNQSQCSGTKVIYVIVADDSQQALFKGEFSQSEEKDLIFQTVYQDDGLW